MAGCALGQVGGWDGVDPADNPVKQLGDFWKVFLSHLVDGVVRVEQIQRATDVAHGWNASGEERGAVTRRLGAKQIGVNAEGAAEVDVLNFLLEDAATPVSCPRTAPGFPPGLSWCIGCRHPELPRRCARHR